MINKDYLFSTTPRQIGLENTIEKLQEAKKALLPENAQKEWELFPDRKELRPYMDIIVDAKMFENNVQRELKDITNEEMAVACVLYTALNVAESIVIMTYNVLSIQEYGKLFNKSNQTMREKLIRGNIEGAFKVSRQWMIPATATYVNYNRNFMKEKKHILRKKPEENSTTNNIEYYTTHTPRQIGHESTEAQLYKDLKAICQPRLQKRHLVFGSLKVALRKLDVVQRPENFEKIIKEKKLRNITPEELAIASAIHTALCLRQAIDFLLYNMMPISDFAKIIQKETAIIRQKCLRGNIEGAMKIGNMWYVPANTKYAYAYQIKNKKKYIGRYKVIK